MVNTDSREQQIVRLPRLHAEAMIAHARSGKPEEICGLVAQDEAGNITATLPVKNAAENKIIHYTMDPLSQHHAFMEIDEQEWDLAGIYHSHPATQAYPSVTDQRMAFDPYDDYALYPDAIYFIISLADDTNPVIRAFLLPDPKTIEELDVVIE